MSGADSDPTYVPATFSLVGWEDEPLVVAWGFVLPDGSAVAVGWKDGPTQAIALCSSAERAAFIFDGDVVWAGTSGE
jgi:hypothetical protein